MPKTSKRRIVQTLYVRVLKWKAFQVEIHPISIKMSTSCLMETTAWFQDSHMQELLLLLRNVMHERALIRSKDLDVVKTSKSEILTGSTVRLGYSLKRKQEHQMCLLPADFSHTHNSETDNATSRYRNLALHSEKLVVYVYPLQGSSQQNMIQLLSALRECNPTPNQKISISSYFQKPSPSMKSSQNITPVNSASSKSSAPATSQKRLVTKDKPATSLGDSHCSRKRTIKSIIQRSGPKLHNTKKRKVVKSEIRSSCTELTKHSREKHVYSETQDKRDEHLLSDTDYKNFKRGAIDENCGETEQQGCDVFRKNCKADGHEDYSVIISESCEKLDNKYSNRGLRDRRKKIVGTQSPSDSDQLELKTSDREKELTCSVTSKSGESDIMFRTLSSEVMNTSAVRDTVAVCPSDADNLPSKLTASSEISNSPDSLEIKNSPHSLEIKSNERKGGLLLLKTKCLSVKMLRKIANHNSSTKSGIDKDKMGESPSPKNINNIKDKICLRSSTKEMVPSSFCTSDKTVFKSKLNIHTEITSDAIEVKSTKGKCGLTVKSKCLSVNMLKKIAKHSSSEGVNKDKMNKLSGSEKTIIDLKDKQNPEEVGISKLGDELSSLSSLDLTDDFTSKPNKSLKTNSNNHGKVTHPLLKSRCLTVKTLKKIANHSSRKCDINKDKMTESRERDKTITDSKNLKHVSRSEIICDPYEFEISPKKSKSEHILQSNPKKSCIKETKLNIKTLDVKDSHAIDVDDEKLPAIFCKKRDRWKKRLTEIFPLPEELNSRVAANTDDEHDVGNSTTKENVDCESFVICISEDEVHGNKDMLISKPGSQLSHLQTEKENIAELTKELKQIQHVNSIQNIHLEKLVFSYETYLRRLFEGQTSCWRHQEYKKGGSSRANLNYCVHFGLFTEEQQDIVMESLMSIFCKKHHRVYIFRYNQWSTTGSSKVVYLDYIMKVLLPEILIKILMAMKDISHNEADTLLATSKL